MQQQTIASERLRESYTKIEHPSGLVILLYPMQGYSSAHALFTAKIGSVDACFKTADDADFVDVPAGIAHFLEHKMFEDEQGDAFARYAATGANANAYTSFDRTAYLFSCSDNFKGSLEILLDFVSSPYFTPETVQKEMGIIGQEIKMYEDNPDWRVLFNLLCALYHHNPVRLDIAGTVESISHIDAALLHRCYSTFYNPRNMVLTVAGNFTAEEVLDVADRLLKPSPDIQIERLSPPEPYEIKERRVVQNLPVAQPLFQIGFKGDTGDETQNFWGAVADEILLDAIAGESTPLYRRLYDEGLINQTFAWESLAGRGYAVNMISGESRDPDAVYAAVTEEVRRIQQEGLDPAVFSRVKKAAYGRYVGAFGRVESVSGMLAAGHLAGIGAYEVPDFVANLTLAQAQARLFSHFDTERCAISIVQG